MAKSKSKKRKEIKRIEEVITKDDDILNKVFIIGGVILFILVFYILSVYITDNNNSETANTPKEVEISQDSIILGRSLSMKGDYYVIYYNNGDTVYDEIVNNYNGELPIYKVDMSSAFNKKYSTDGESNKNPSKASEFLINGPTLIKVSNKSVVEYIEGEEAIRTSLN